MFELFFFNHNRLCGLIWAVRDDVIYCGMREVDSGRGKGTDSNLVNQERGNNVSTIK